MKNSFKLVSSFCVALLAFGAGVALSSTNKESKSVSASGDTTIFLTQNWSWTDLQIHSWGANDDWCSMTEAFINKEGQKVFEGTIPSGNTGFQFKGNENGDKYTVDITEIIDNQGYYFSEWDSGQGKGKVAKWTVYPYELNLEGNGASGGEMNPTRAFGNVSWRIPKNTFVKEGFVFDGWNTSNDGCGDAYDDEGLLPEKTDTSSFTLYAQWKLAPVPIEDGYYVIGSMNDWTESSEYKMAYKSETEEYYLEMNLEEGDEFKILKCQDGSRVAYYGFEDLDWGEGSARDAAQIIAGDSSNMKVAVAGTYKPYFRTKITDRPIWINEYVVTHDYALTVNGTDAYDLVSNPSKPNEYMTETTLALTSGDVVAYTCDDVVVEGQTSKQIGNNNCWDDDGTLRVCLNVTDKVYVDVVNKTVFCAGLELDKFYMSVDNSPVVLQHNETPVEPSFTEYYTTGYEFSEGAVIKFVDTTSTNKNATVFNVLKVNEASTAGFEVVDGVLKCTAEGGKSTNAYVKFKYGEDEVYFGDVSEDLAAAIKFAKEFNTALEAVCVAQGETVVGDLQAAWKAEAGEFDKLIDATKTILKAATKDYSNLDVASFAVKYDYVYSHYSVELAEHGGNFVDRTPVAAAPFLFGLTSDNSTLITIVVICSVSSVTLLGVTLLIKRRRNAVK